MAASLDWPLSRKEKEVRLVSLFQSELEHGEDQRRKLKSELVKARRRASLPAESPSKSSEARRRASLPAGSPAQAASVTSPLQKVEAGDVQSRDQAGPIPCALAPSASSPCLSTPQATPASHVLQTTPETTPTTSPRRQSMSRAQKASEAVAKAVARSVSTSSLPTSGSRDGSAEAGSAAEEEVAEPTPSLSARQVCLRAALISFYKERQINGVAQANRLASMCGGTSKIDEIEIWAHIAIKYNALPVQAVSYLARTLSPLTLVQWPKDQVPDTLREALDRIAAETGASGSTMHSRQLQEVQVALKAEDNQLLSGLTFRSCPTSGLRPEVWRALLNGRRKKNVPLNERREQYRKLRERAASADLKAASSDERGEDSRRAELLAARQEIADRKSVWSGEAFLALPGVDEAVASIAWTTAVRYGRYVRGSCEMATLLLFVMSNEGKTGDLADAEADAFWCLSQVMLEMNSTLAAGEAVQNQAKQAQHIQYLLRLYDPVLAELLRAAGIVALPTTRLGVALCTRAGFSLPGCTRLWDALLADPKRFEFCNYAIVAVLLLSRERLLKQHDDHAALAEAVLSAPRQADMDMVLSTAYAICAFERRCGDSSPVPFPPRPGVLEVIPSALEAAQTHLSSAWGKIRPGMVGIWRKAKNGVEQAAAAHAKHVAEQADRDRQLAQTYRAGTARGGENVAQASMTAALEVGLI